MKRGEIWFVNLDPTVGSEIQKTRPCVIISPPEMHDYLRTAIIAPMTTGSHPAPFRIRARHGGKDGLILLDQIRAIDKIAPGKARRSFIPVLDERDAGRSRRSLRQVRCN